MYVNGTRTLTLKPTLKNVGEYQVKCELHDINELPRVYIHKFVIKVNMPNIPTNDTAVVLP